MLTFGQQTSALGSGGTPNYFSNAIELLATNIKTVFDRTQIIQQRTRPSGCEEQALHSLKIFHLHY